MSRVYQSYLINNQWLLDIIYEYMYIMNEYNA